MVRAPPPNPLSTSALSPACLNPPPTTPRTQRADGVKYTLNKLEQVSYDLSLSSGGYLPKGGARDVGPPPAAEGGGEGGEEGGGQKRPRKP